MHKTSKTAWYNNIDKMIIEASIYLKRQSTNDTHIYCLKVYFWGYTFLRTLQILSNGSINQNNMNLQKCLVKWYIINKKVSSIWYEINKNYLNIVHIEVYQPSSMINTWFKNKAWEHCGIFLWRKIWPNILCYKFCIKEYLCVNDVLFLYLVCKLYHISIC